MNIANPNAQKGIFLAPPQDLTLIKSNNLIGQIDYEWLLWIIRNDDALRFYGSPPWRRLRLEIMVRDHYTCQRCEYNHKLTILTDKATNQNERCYIHHIAELKKFPELAMHKDNLVTLCHKCHEDVHDRTQRWQKPEQKPFTNFDASEQW